MSSLPPLPGSSGGGNRYSTGGSLGVNLPPVPTSSVPPARPILPPLPTAAAKPAVLPPLPTTAPKPSMAATSSGLPPLPSEHYGAQYGIQQQSYGYTQQPTQSYEQQPAPAAATTSPVVRALFRFTLFFAHLPVLDKETACAIARDRRWQ